MPKERTKAPSHADVSALPVVVGEDVLLCRAFMAIAIHPSDPLLERVRVGREPHVEGDVRLLEVAPDVTGVVDDQHPALVEPRAHRLLALHLGLPGHVPVDATDLLVSERRRQRGRQGSAAAEHDSLALARRALDDLFGRCGDGTAADRFAALIRMSASNQRTGAPSKTAFSAGRSAAESRRRRAGAPEPRRRRRSSHRAGRPGLRARGRRRQGRSRRPGQHRHSATPRRRPRPPPPGSRRRPTARPWDATAR